MCNYRLTDYVFAADNYVQTNYVKSKEPSLWTARGINIILIPCSIITIAIDTVVGLGASLTSGVTLGLSRPVNCFVRSHLCTCAILRYPYSNLIRVIHPDTDFKDDKTPYIQALAEYAKNLYLDGRDFEKHHVVPRLCGLVLVVAALVESMAYAIIAVVATPLSLVTLGYFSSINQVAIRVLRFTMFGESLVKATLLFINPNILWDRLEDLTPMQLIESDGHTLLDSLSLKDDNQKEEFVHCEQSQPRWERLSVKQQIAIYHNINFAFKEQLFTDVWEWKKQKKPLGEEMTKFSADELNVRLPYITEETDLKAISDKQLKQIDAATIMACKKKNLRNLVVDKLNPDAQTAYRRKLAS